MYLSSNVIEQYKILLGVDSLPLVWTERDLDRLGVRSVHSLRRDRVVGNGIPFLKSQGEIKYPVLEVLEWMESNLRHSTSQYSNQ